MRSLRDLSNRTPVPMASRQASQFGRSTVRADAVTEMRAAESVSTLFSIVSRLSTSTARAEWNLLRKPPLSNPDAPPRAVAAHAAADLWAQPNEFMTTQAFVETAQQHLDLTGETFWVIAYDPQFPAVPLEIWPVRPDRMTPVPHPTDFLAGWVYRSPDGERIPLARNEVIQVKMPHPMNTYRGLGPVQALLADLDSARYAAEWNRNFFENSAQPGGVIEVENRLSDDEFEEMTGRWREQHQGVANAHRVAVIERGKWVSNGYSPREMQFVDVRNVSREVIREAFGMHLQFLGGSEMGHSRAEAEAAEVIFATWLIEPRLDRLRGVLNSQFLALFGQPGKSVYFDYCSPVPGDEAATNASRESQATTFKTLVDAGVHPDDAALVAGLPPMRHTGQPVQQELPVGGGV